MTAITQLEQRSGNRSWHQAFMDKGPRSRAQERTSYILDFAKHGFMELDESTRFDTTTAEGLMRVCIDLHHQIIGALSPLMRLYWLRMLFCL
jgi:hypothetical protein